MALCLANAGLPLLSLWPPISLVIWLESRIYLMQATRGRGISKHCSPPRTLADCGLRTLYGMFFIFLAVTVVALMGHTVALELPTFIADNMVLARSPLAPRLWGKGTAGETVIVSLNGKESWKTVVDTTGNWILDIDEQEASEVTESKC